MPQDTPATATITIALVKPVPPGSLHLAAMNIFKHPGEVGTKELLLSCNLPVQDLATAHFEHFFGCGSELSPDGVVGLELYGTSALLRSLAVTPKARGLGCGRRLVAKAEAHAAAQGATMVYLLTNTAKAFFQALGYSVAERLSAPPAIQDTKEFSYLCPASATFMEKRITG